MSGLEIRELGRLIRGCGRPNRRYGRHIRETGHLIVSIWQEETSIYSNNYEFDLIEIEEERTATTTGQRPFWTPDSTCASRKRKVFMRDVFYQIHGHWSWFLPDNHQSIQS